MKKKTKRINYLPHLLIILATIGIGLSIYYTYTNTQRNIPKIRNQINPQQPLQDITFIGGNSPKSQSEYLKITLSKDASNFVDWTQTQKSGSTIYLNMPDCALYIGGIGGGGPVGAYIFKEQKIGRFYYSFYAWKFDSTINAHSDNGNIRFEMHSSIGTDSKNFNECVNNIKSVFTYITAEYVQ